MKVIKVLDAKSTSLVSDPLNQLILKNLVMTEYSVSELAKEVNVPTLKLWRRMQKLLKAEMVELTRTIKTGNLEKKMYRATATWFAPHQYFNFNPKDQALKAAFEIYSDIQKDLLTAIAPFTEIPKNVDPVDFSLFANMQAFVKVCEKSSTQTKITKLRKELSQYQHSIDETRIKK
jgi:hypothetical protein